MAIWTMEIPGWHPAPLNKLLGSHWGAAARMKSKDKQIIANAVMAYQVPPAFGKRRVSLTIVYPKGKRKHDPDAFFKSLNDALVHSKALFADTSNYIELGSIKYAKGDELTSYVTLEDV